MHSAFLFNYFTYLFEFFLNEYQLKCNQTYGKRVKKSSVITLTSISFQSDNLQEIIPTCIQKTLEMYRVVKIFRRDFQKMPTIRPNLFSEKPCFVEWP